jgi:LysM repeat protein
MRGKIILILAASVLFISTSAWGQQKISIDEYIASWKYVAVKQMEEHGIPASIILAQGILESGFGNSKLAREGNNHFGIKCHDWDGEFIFKDDDKKNECFRKYKNAMASYEDHSLFLTTRNRYASLFELKRTDYKSWAKGLKKAGYATNPKYPRLLIDLIEKNKLYKFDQMQSVDLAPLMVQQEESQETVPSEKAKREVMYNKRLKYIVAKKGDTFYQIAEDLDMTIRQLNRYNDFPKTKDHLVEGDIVYIMPKKRKANRAMRSVKMNEEQQAWEVSQKQGVRLSSVLDLNNLEGAEDVIGKGSIVVLR